MSRVAPTVPAESDILCEGCGYTLTGLGDDGRCPECGKPIAESQGTQRTAPAWEHPQVHRPAGFIHTTAGILFRPTPFYRTLATRLDMRPAKTFARLHWAIAAVLFGVSAFVHLSSMGMLYYPSGTPMPPPPKLVLFVSLIAITYASLESITWIAAKLTNWEATYRGLRLPIGVVRRGMYYHAAHYLPVALVALATVTAYYAMRRSGRYDDKYLYVLAAEVILGAAYLFHTYWIGMRNMMYANR